MDTFDPAQRSAVMAKVKSKGNKSTEWRVRAWLMRAGLSGWRVCPSDIPGSPDFVFDKQRVVIFTDGCFWHGCPRCAKRPSSNTTYWDKKIQRNCKRDRRITSALRREGWKVLRIWEHDLNKPARVLDRIARRLHSD
jgi:DNA mismatch endonuclease (patch repair protein)